LILQDIKLIEEAVDNRLRKGMVRQMDENQEWMDAQDPVKVKTKEETDKKCPACGGTMDFDPETGGLLCPYCGYKAEIEKVDMEGTSAKEQRLEDAETTGNCDWGAEKKTVICQSCGAESIYDALQISNECPYCGSNQVMEAKGMNTLAPGGVCVFKVTDNEAGERFKAWMKRRIFCPREAKQKASPKAFKGVYLPYWTFDAETHSDYSAEYGINRTREDSEGHTQTETDWYKIRGEFDKFINDQPVLASTKHDTDMLKKLEPFLTEDNLLYKPEYVAGFISERYSVGLHDGWEKAKGMITKTLEGEIKSDIKSKKHADSVRKLLVKTEYDDIAYKYLLLPIWISSFKYKNKIYQFVVNGQTGRVAGKTPISALRVAIAVLLAIAFIALIVMLQNS